jgi:hypothetical protein
MPVLSYPRKKSATLFASTVGDTKPVFTERFSDCWPDWSTPLTQSDLAEAAARNRPSEVFAQVGKAVAAIVGLVLLVHAALLVFHLN